MAEANHSVQLTKLRASMSLATNTLALQRALNLTKRQLQAQGLRPSHFSHRDLVIRSRAIPRRAPRGADRRSEGDRRALGSRRLLWKARRHPQAVIKQLNFEQSQIEWSEANGEFTTPADLTNH